MADKERKSQTTLEFSELHFDNDSGAIVAPSLAAFVDPLDGLGKPGKYRGKESEEAFDRALSYSCSLRT
jgi:hypothetical protein